MAPRALSHARKATRVVALLVPAAFVGLVTGLLGLLGSEGCIRSAASLGQTCLTNEDCFSGYCAQQICVSAPPLLDAEYKAPADASVESATVDGAAEASHSETSTDASADGPADSGRDADAGNVADAGSDAPSDVRLDVVEGG